MTAYRIAPALLLFALLAGCADAVPGRSGDGRVLATTGATASSAASSTPRPGAATVSCTWRKVPAGATIKDVGTPAASVPGKGLATMAITTDQGALTVTMDATATPCTVASFAHLAGKRYFDNSVCHRLTQADLSVLQCGDPSGTGTGGPSYQFGEEALAGAKYPRGTVAMARTQEPGTNGSQFFIVYRDAGNLPPDYTPFGRVTRGMDVVDKVAAGGIDATDPAYPNDGKPKLQPTLQTVTVTYM